MKFLQKIFNRNKITAKQQKTTKVNLEELQKYIQKKPSDSLKNIAKEFNVNKTTINRLITKFDLNYQRKPSFKEIGDSKKREVDLNEIKKYIKNNSDKTLQQISKVFNISEPYLRKLIKTNNIEYEKKSSMSVFCRDVIEMKKAIAELTNKISELEIENKKQKDIKISIIKHITYEELLDTLISNYSSNRKEIAKILNITEKELKNLLIEYKLLFFSKYERYKSYITRQKQQNKE